MKEDLEQTGELELGRERIADPPHGRLKARALALDELEPAVGLIDALPAIPRQRREEKAEREHKQDRDVVLSHGERGKEAHRSQACIDRPDQPDDAHLKPEVGHHPGEAHPRERAGQVDDASGRERRRQQRESPETDRWRNPPASARGQGR